MQKSKQKEIIQILEFLKLSGINHLKLNSETDPYKTLCSKLKKINSEKFNIKNFSFDSGNIYSNLMIIGDKPESHNFSLISHEIKTLLIKMLKAIKIDFKNTYFTNLYKFASLIENNDLTKELNFINYQISIIQPKLLIVLGELTAQTLLNSNNSISDLRSEKWLIKNIPTFITHHPKTLIKKQELKKEAWVDLQQIEKFINNNEIEL